jgi:hypothetical protein
MKVLFTYLREKTYYKPELPPFNVQKAENGPEKAENDTNSTAKKLKKSRRCFLVSNHLLSIVLAR